jgi:hypothetical protein
MAFLPEFKSVNAKLYSIVVPLSLYCHSIVGVVANVRYMGSLGESTLIDFSLFGSFELWGKNPRLSRAKPRPEANYAHEYRRDNR